ncbi:autoinducer binding domain-containing protein [Albimonas sp. CAU 1670]|uniref:helix-turn-helix transcriptional regulator n=1 Tax=Albimonas sp. CAU 1670 TaxID=3032599 RepID=UPI0023DBE2D9|nr:autoinducer binding domain-containing protein [Albimonas sp. CAU 1670]MDF2231152.1 autoinducer binding domain-containing protein [Albimonas sp. CAU 1670]
MTSQPDLAALLRAVRRAYDLDNCIYYALNLGGPRGGDEFGAMTYPEAWHQRYEEVRYRDLDPVVTASLGGFAPIDWKDLDWSGRPVRRLLSEAHEFRVGNHGYTVPIHGPNGQFAMFSVSKQCAERRWTLLLAEAAQEWLIIAHHVHRQALEMTGAVERQPPPPLSPRERDALALMAAGRSRAQVAHRLKISESTLRVYLDSARHKLGGLNAVHAVALAVKSGAVKI